MNMGGSNTLTSQLIIIIISVTRYKVLRQIFQAGAHVNTSSQTCRNFSEWLWHGQDKVIKGSRNLCTARRRILRRLCFYTCLSVIQFTGGCLPQCILGYIPPPRADTPGDQTPPPPAADTPRLDIPQEQTPPPQEQCMMEDTGNKRAVRILLECILVTC